MNRDLVEAVAKALAGDTWKDAPEALKQEMREAAEDAIWAMIVFMKGKDGRE